MLNANLWNNLLAAFAETTAPATGTTEAAASSSSGIVSTVIMMVAMVAIFYFLMIRPQRKKDKKVKDMLSALKVGDRICTIGGIYGTVLQLKDDSVTLAVGAQKTQLVMARWSIRSVEDAAVENDAEPQV
ncbi:MAG: preprotein translocase subunit YajC [Clostridiales bacterium]|jgi:preprotein translocase subunit YajC|nr:preprotein translocase subunit YajC [Clostridiales bacterium]